MVGLAAPAAMASKSSVAASYTPFSVSAIFVPAHRQVVTNNRITRQRDYLLRDSERESSENGLWIFGLGRLLFGVKMNGWMGF